MQRLKDLKKIKRIISNIPQDIKNLIIRPKNERFKFEGIEKKAIYVCFEIEGIENTAMGFYAFRHQGILKYAFWTEFCIHKKKWSASEYRAIVNTEKDLHLNMHKAIQLYFNEYEVALTKLNKDS